MTVASVLFSVMLASATEEARPRLALLPEIIKRLEAIPATVNVDTLDHLDVPVDSLVTRLYPLVVHPVELPQVVEKNGKRTVVREPCDAAQPALAHAEKAFAAKDYAE